MTPGGNFSTSVCGLATTAATKKCDSWEKSLIILLPRRRDFWLLFRANGVGLATVEQ